MGKQNVVFVCHNVFPHERFPLDKLLTKLVLKSGKHYIVHAKEEGRELEQIRQDADYTVTPHPTYNAFRFEGMSKRQAREWLHIGQEARILLFFGYVREYKGLKYLLQAMPQIIQGQMDIGGGIQSRIQTGERQEEANGVQLWVVGEFGADKEEYMSLISELGIGACVEVVDSYTPDREVEKYFAAADLVVLPYTSATQSGIVQIAYGFTKPVIVTEVGGLPDVVEDGKTGYVVKPEKPEEIARAVLRFYQDGMEQPMTENIRAEAYRFSWERMADVVKRFME